MKRKKMIIKKGVKQMVKSIIEAFAKAKTIDRVQYEK